jgi:hypothetical protein
VVTFKTKGQQNRTEQNRTEQNRTEQNRTEQNRTEQNRTEQNRTEQNRTEQKPIRNHLKSYTKQRFMWKRGMKRDAKLFNSRDGEGCLII